MNIVARIRTALAGRIFPRPTEAPDIAEPEFLPTTEQIEAAAADLKRGRALESEGRALVSRAKKVLDRTPDGTYGNAVISRKENTPVLDQRAARKLLEAEGIAVPLMERAPTVVASFTESFEAPAENPAPEPAVEQGVVPASIPQDIADFFDQYRPAALAA